MFKGVHRIYPLPPPSLGLAHSGAGGVHGSSSQGEGMLDGGEPHFSRPPSSISRFLPLSLTGRFTARAPADSISQRAVSGHVTWPDLSRERLSTGPRPKHKHRPCIGRNGEGRGHFLKHRGKNHNNKRPFDSRIVK